MTAESRFFHSPESRRIATTTLVLLLTLVAASCGETFRPIAQPVLGPQPDPAAFHFVISVNTNGSADPGSAERIDVSGDTAVGVFQTGVAPAHAALIPNGTKLYVANPAEDTVSANNTSSPTVVTTVTLPPGSHPVFVHTAENGNVYVANYQS